jgi:CRP/FNR family transcriptional regulator, cyclic AMP receptor protein
MEGLEQGLERIVRQHPFFADLGEDFYSLLAGCSKNVRFETGQIVLRQGEAADTLYLLRQGRVALGVAAPARGGPRTLQTLGEGDLLGVSWLIPPYRWSYDARALELVRAIAIDASCLRQKCEDDHDLGYELMKRFVPVLIRRLQSARTQMLDLYAFTA